MSALRRDLIERKMWIAIALLIAALVAVPMLLVNDGSTNGAAAAPPPPPAATSAPAVAKSPSAGPRPAPSRHGATKVADARASRDPFTAATALTTSTSATTLSSPSASAPATGSSSGATPVAMVSPSPSSSGGQSAVSGSAAPATPTSTVTSTTTTTSTAKPASSTPVSTTASATPAPTAKVQSWTTYSVAVRYGKDTSVRLRSDIARLTPLPSASQPAAMFLGVMTGGKQAVFALRAGLGHTGPGLCRPGHTRCSAILLKAKQSEQLTVPSSDGSLKHVILRVVRITHRVTHSRKLALAAYERYSAAGVCDLALADPVLYNLETGTVTGVPKAVCDKQPKSVPFTPLVTTP